MVEEETFTTECTWCRAETPHTRIRRTERYAFLGIRGPKTGLEEHRVRCAICQGEQHVRDLASLDSPVLADQYATALRAAVAELDLGTADAAARSAAITVIRPFQPTYDEEVLDSDRRDRFGDRLDGSLDDLLENFHSSIHRRWLAAVIYVAAGLPDRSHTIDDHARRLAMSARDLEEARRLAAPGDRGDREAG